MKNKHIGSNFDDFLEEEGILAEVEAVALKRVLAYEIEKNMKAKQVTKSKMASLMNTSRSALDRLLDPENPSVTLLTMEKAALSMGKRLKVELI